MHIPLNEFEQFIDEKILKRGFSYFNKGAIVDFLEISTGSYEAIVSGTEEYTVHLEVENNTIVSHNCDCPYDYGPVCKHVAAAIFHLQQDELELNQSNAPKPKRKKTKTVSQQIKELLKTVSHQELTVFIQERCENDTHFRQQFLSSFGHLSHEQSKEFYQKQIHSILRDAKGRHGWIEWHDMQYLVYAIQPFLDNSENFLANKNFENVFYINTALLEEMTDALQYADDSNGDIGYFISSALEFLFNLTQENLPKSLKKELFDYGITAFNQKLFDGWDWNLQILHIASELIEKESDADTILHCLDKIVDSSYERQRAEFIKLDILRKFKSESEVEAFINKHISNYLIRTEEIERAFDKKDFNRVIELSNDGILYDQNESPGYVIDWYKWLLRVAQSQQDTPKIIEYSRLLYMDNFHSELDYYQILKDAVDKESWHPFLEDIISEITSKQRWRASGKIREIYVREAWWDRLLILLKENSSLSKIEQEESYLSKDYAPELIELYNREIRVYVEENKSRTHYQEACRYLRRMKKLGGVEHVNNLIVEFRKQYPRRRALMEELDKV